MLSIGMILIPYPIPLRRGEAAVKVTAVGLWINSSYLSPDFD